MKIPSSPLLAGLLILAAGSLASSAAERGLKIGDPAPKLQTGKWLQGEPVTSLQTGKVYLVEFWATWSDPSRAAIPHLNDLHNRFKSRGLVVIGLDCWERDPAALAPFLKKMGDKLSYRVALDDKSAGGKGSMVETWKDAAGQYGIPCVFVVDTRGQLAWMGHPDELKPELIDEVLAGRFDVQKAALDFDRREKETVRLQIIERDLSRAIELRNWDGALRQLSEMGKLVSEERRVGLDLTRFSILLGKKDLPAAYKLAATLSANNLTNAVLQNDLAWQIITDRTTEHPDLELAETIATRANDAAKGKDAGIVDTVARVRFMQGKRKEAIALQEKAVKLAEPSLKGELKKTLDSYKRGELPKPD